MKSDIKNKKWTKIYKGNELYYCFKLDDNGEIHILQALKRENLEENISLGNKFKGDAHDHYYKKGGKWHVQIKKPKNRMAFQYAHEGRYEKHYFPPNTPFGIDKIESYLEALADRGRKIYRLEKTGFFEKLKEKKDEIWELKKQNKNISMQLKEYNEMLNEIDGICTDVYEEHHNFISKTLKIEKDKFNINANNFNRKTNIGRSHYNMATRINTDTQTLLELIAQFNSFKSQIEEKLNFLKGHIESLQHGQWDDPQYHAFKEKFYNQIGGQVNALSNEIESEFIPILNHYIQIIEQM